MVYILADPKLDPTATKFDTITYLDVINKNLQIMDQTAVTLCMDNKIDLCVFNMQEEGNIARAVSGDRYWNNNFRRKIK